MNVAHVAPTGTPFPGHDNRSRLRRLVDRLLRRKPGEWTEVGFVAQDLPWTLSDVWIMDLRNKDARWEPVGYFPRTSRRSTDVVSWSWTNPAWADDRYKRRIDEDLEDTRRRVQLMFVDAWARYGWARPGGRPSTPDRPNGRGGKRITVKRCCNGCGRELGDATDGELLDAIAGLRLPDVREECGCRG